jgi:hemolysin III
MSTAVEIAEVSERRFVIGKEPASALSHLVGFVFALVGAGYLISQSLGDPVKTATMIGYSVGLAALFLASTVYHGMDLGTRGNLFLRRLDHTAIFLLIAGSYLPVVMHTLDGAWRWAMVGVLAGLTLVGLVVKLAWMSSPRWLSGGIYLLLGWVGVVRFTTWYEMLEPLTFGLLVAGGVTYSVGAVIYATKKPDPWPGVFGFHEVWHLFVLGGAGMHFAMMVTLLDAPYTPF